MTNKVGFLVLFGSVLLLTACSGKVEKTELTSQTSEISTISTTEIELKQRKNMLRLLKNLRSCPLTVMIHSNQQLREQKLKRLWL